MTGRASSPSFSGSKGIRYDGDLASDIAVADLVVEDAKSIAVPKNQDSSIHDARLKQLEGEYLEQIAEMRSEMEKAQKAEQRSSIHVLVTFVSEVGPTKFACAFVQPAIVQLHPDFRDMFNAGRNSFQAASSEGRNRKHRSICGRSIAQTMEAAAAVVPATGAEEDEQLETMTVAEPEMEVEEQPSEART